MKILQKIAETKINLKNFIFHSTAVSIAIIYFFYRPGLIAGAMMAGIFYLAIKLLFGKKTFNVRIRIYYFLILVIIFSFCLLNIYNHYFHKTLVEVAMPIEGNIIYTNLGFLKTIMVAILSLSLYLISSILIGNRILKNLFSIHPDNLTRLGHMFLSYLLGLIIISFLFFFAAIAGQLTLITSILVLLLPVILFSKDLISFIRQGLQLLTYKLQTNISVPDILIDLLILITVSALVVDMAGSFISGSDGLRAYLVTVRYIAENHSLPNPVYQFLLPFPAEILIVPAFILDKIPLSRLLLYSLSSFYILGAWLIAKEIFPKRRFPLWGLLPVFLFPAVIQMFAGEFKIDVFALLFGLGGFYTLILSIKEKNVGYVYLTAVILGYSFLIKITSVFFIIPLGLFLIVLIYRKHKINLIKTLFFTGFLFFLPILIWTLPYGTNIPYIGNVPQKETGIALIENSCSKELLSLEQELLYGGYGKTILGYAKLPLAYLKATGPLLTVSLLDPGLYIFILIIYVIFSKFKWVSKLPKMWYVAFVISFLSLSLFWALSPILIWYALTPFVILILLLIALPFYQGDEYFVKIYKNWFKFIATSTMLSIILIHSLLKFFPINLTQEQVLKYLSQDSQSSRYNIYYQSYEISEHLNKEKSSKILFSTNASLANINYFIEDYYTRYIHLNDFTNDQTKSEIESVISTFRPKYLVYNKMATKANIPCLNETQPKIEEVFKQKGTLLIENDSYAVYEVIIDDN